MQCRKVSISAHHRVVGQMYAILWHHGTYGHQLSVHKWERATEIADRRCPVPDSDLLIRVRTTHTHNQNDFARTHNLIPSSCPLWMEMVAAQWRFIISSLQSRYYNIIFVYGGECERVDPSYKRSRARFGSALGIAGHVWCYFENTHIPTTQYMWTSPRTAQPSSDETFIHMNPYTFVGANFNSLSMQSST